jgi:DnaK suppressor protein
VNEQELGQTKEKLLRLKLELQDQGKASGDAGEPVELDQSRVGRVTRMDAMQSQQMALEVGRRRQQQLIRIEGALRRIEAGEYGYCFVCGGQIDERRLSIDPTHTRCMRCVEN